MKDELYDARQWSPAAQRNREYILKVLRQVLPPTGTVLEVASGSGEHAIVFAPELAPRQWLPSDPNLIALASIAAWRETYPAPNLYPPIRLDVTEDVWTVEQQSLPVELLDTDFELSDITAIANINMIHISPWSACLGLMAGANRILSPGGILYLYGPYKQQGNHTAESNRVFDENLRSQNPAWGVRDLEAVIEAAAVQNLAFVKTVSMPANNLSVILQKF